MSLEIPESMDIDELDIGDLQLINSPLSANTYGELGEGMLYVDDQEQSQPEAVNGALGGDAFLERLEGAERRDAAQASARAKLQPTCWGGILKNDGGCCTPGFTIGKKHFKDKFCADCREGFDLPLANVRALTTDLQPCFSNPHTAGFWGTAAASVGGGEVRLINQTKTCDGPMLAIYRSAPPTLQWATLPANWVAEDSTIRLVIAKQTLVPKEAMSPLRHKRSCETSSASMASRRYRQSGSVADDPQTSPSPHMDPLVAIGPQALPFIDLADFENAVNEVVGDVDDPHAVTAPAETAEELASRLTATHQQLVAMLEASLKPASTVLSTLTEEQTAWLRLQLNASRKALQASPTLGERTTAASTVRVEADIPHSRIAEPCPKPIKKQRSRSGPSKLEAFQQQSGLSRRRMSGLWTMGTSGSVLRLSKSENERMADTIRPPLQRGSTMTRLSSTTAREKASKSWTRTLARGLVSLFGWNKQQSNYDTPSSSPRW